MNQEYKSKILSLVQKYIDTGVSALDSWQEDREKAEHVWDGEFYGSDDKRPDNVFFYPVVYARLRRNVIAIRKVYKSAADLVSVTIEEDFPENDKVKISDATRQMMNRSLTHWNDMTAFIDDTATQVVKHGICWAKVYYDRRKEKRTYSVPGETRLEVDDEGNTQEITETKDEEREEIVHNHLCIEYVPIKDILHDNTKTFGQCRWVIQRNIPKTVDELWDEVNSNGFNQEAVSGFIDKHKAEITPENDRIFISEFWGWLPLPQDNPEGTPPKNVKFVKMVIDDEGEFILKDPEEDVYTYIDGTPMMNFEAGYLIRHEGRIRGDSWVMKERDLQGEVNAIRNQRRKSVQRDLDQTYVTQKDAEIEFSKLAGSGMGDVISVNDINGFKEIQRRDNTAGSYAELEAVNRDLDTLDGMTSYALGMADPHVTDTLGGIQLMSNASNAVIYDNIVSYNEFFENILTKGLHLILQYATDEEFAEAGVDLSKVSRDEMLKKLKVKIDCGLGATSEIMRINNYTKAFFLSQQWLQHCLAMKIEPMRGRYAPTIALRNMFPLLNTKDVAAWVPSVEELEENTRMMMEAQMQQEQEMENQEGMVLQNEVQKATQAGIEAGQQEGMNAQNVQQPVV